MFQLFLLIVYLIDTVLFTNTQPLGAYTSLQIAKSTFCANKSSTWHISQSSSHKVKSLQTRAFGQKLQHEQFLGAQLSRLDIITYTCKLSRDIFLELDLHRQVIREIERTISVNRDRSSCFFRPKCAPLPCHCAQPAVLLMYEVYNQTCGTLNFHCKKKRSIEACQIQEEDDGKIMIISRSHATMWIMV